MAKIRLALKKEGIRSKEARSRQEESQFKNISTFSPELFEKGKALEFIAQDTGVSARSVERFKYIEKKTPNLVEEIGGWDILNTTLVVVKVFPARAR